MDVFCIRFLMPTWLMVATGFQVIDISKSYTPQRLSDQWDTPGYANGVCVSGHYAFVADGV